MEEIQRAPLGVNETQNPSITQQIPKTEPPKKNRKKLLIIVSIVLLILAATLYAIFSFELLDSFNILKKTETQEEITNEEEEVNPEEVLTTYEGTTVTAQLPNNWSIEEYYDGEGTSMLTEGVTYEGLTGLKIFKEDTEIFYLKAIYGIGFAGCSHYAKFIDENPTYYTQIVADNEISGTIAEVVDYTDSEYIEFEWLGRTFRRIGTYYNYDTVDGNSYFEPSCVPTLVTFPGLQFYPEGGPPATAYDYGPTDFATLEDLLVVDTILESMVLSD